MNRKHKRLQKKTGRKLMQLGWNEFENIINTPEAQNAISNYSLYSQNDLPCEIWKNNIFIVQVFERRTEWGLIKKAMIRRNDEAPVHNWAVIQRIKNEIFGPEKTALEVFPKQSKLVDMANLYWIWVLPDDYNCPIEI